MTFPQKDTYMLQVEGCTFFIQREESPATWLLSYQTASGHYHYRRCSTAKECAALLGESHHNEKEWISLNERIPSLVLPSDALELSTWVGVIDAPPA